MIKIVEGNILDCEEDVIGHQVNCIGVMGGGLAKQIKEKYPDVYHKYRNYFYSYDIGQYSRLLGECYIIPCYDGKYVANLFGQDKTSRFRRMTDYKALEKSLAQLKEFSKRLELSVALPYQLGCGLAGGDWGKVYKIIERVFNDYEVTLYKFIK